MSRIRQLWLPIRSNIISKHHQTFLKSWRVRHNQFIKQTGGNRVFIGMNNHWFTVQEVHEFSRKPGRSITGRYKGSKLHCNNFILRYERGNTTNARTGTKPLPFYKPAVSNSVYLQKIQTGRQISDWDNTATDICDVLHADTMNGNNTNLIIQLKAITLHLY